MNGSRAARLIAAIVVLSIAPSVQAEDTTAGATPRPAPRFVLPFQLRPMIAKTLVRDDVVFSTHAAGSTLANVTTLSYSFLPNVAVLARVPYVASTPKTGPRGTAFGNPLLGGLYTPALRPTTRLSLFVGVAFPLGQGGGNAPDKANASAEAAAIYGRAAMDNALWVPDYVVGVAGAGIAEAVGPCTVQVEGTVLQLVRVSGADAQKDASRTNLTTGLLGGCYVRSPVQLVAELRYQRWLSTPAAVAIDAAKRQQATAGLGLRFDVKAGAATLRPGVMLAAPIDDPMRKADYRQVLFDVPVVF